MAYTKKNPSPSNRYTDTALFSAFDDAIFEAHEHMAAGPLYAYEEGVRASNTATSNTTNLNAAAAQAKSERRELILPAGVINLNGQITFDDVIVEGQGHENTALKWSTGLGSGVQAITLDQDNAWHGQLRDLRLDGPGGNSLGVKGANCDGVRMINSTKLYSVKSTGFDSGAIVNTTSGHCSFHGCILTNNYYGLYFANPGAGNGDYLIFDSGLDGNYMASIGITEAQALTGAAVIRSHLGYGPYGIYQEAGSTAAQMMVGCRLLDCRFEGIGNGAIYSEKFANGGDQGGFSANYLEDVGFGWGGAEAKIAARNKNYAVVLGKTDRSNYYRSGLYSFSNGDVGAWYIHNNSAYWFWDESSSENASGTLTVNSGSSDRFRYIPSFPASIAGTTQFNSGSANNATTSIAIDYAGPISSVRPIVTPTSDGGLTGPFQIVATVTASNPVTQQTDITFKLKSSASTSSALTFTWRLA